MHLLHISNETQIMGIDTHGDANEMGGDFTNFAETTVGLDVNIFTSGQNYQENIQVKLKKIHEQTNFEYSKSKSEYLSFQGYQKQE